MRTEKSTISLAFAPEIGTLEQLRRHYDAPSVRVLLATGELFDWLMDHGHDEEARATSRIDPSAPDVDEQLCGVFGVRHAPLATFDVPAQEHGGVFPKHLGIRLTDLERMTAEEVARMFPGHVAFTQADFEHLAEAGETEVFLCGPRFKLPSAGPHMVLLGVGKPVLRIEGAFADRLRDAWHVVPDVSSDGMWSFWSSVRARPVLGERLLRSGADSGRVLAQWLLGRLLADSPSESDRQEGVRWWQRAADSGCAPALLDLGRAYEEGRDIRMDERKAHNCYELAMAGLTQAAERGEGWAMGFLGECCLNGDGMEENEAEALGYFEKGAARDDAESQYFLGRAHRFGELGMDRDAALGTRWLLEAARQGHTDAFQILVDTAPSGFGSDVWTETFTEAWTFLREAAAKGDARAQWAVGAAYRWIDARVALEWWSRSAEGGFARAAVDAADLCTDGLQPGRQPGFEKAVALYERAAALGSSEGAYKLGRLVARGLGTAKDSHKACRLYRQAAESGYYGAFEVGLCHDLGIGTDQDKELALAWYAEAVRRMSPRHPDGDAPRHLDIMARRGCEEARQMLEGLALAREQLEQPQDGIGFCATDAASTDMDAR